MADKRQTFRFRFPWSHSSRSKDEPKTKNPAQSTSKAIADDRPPFRPAGKAPVKGTSSQVHQGPQNTNPPSLHAASESSKKSHPTTQQSSPSSPVSSQSQPIQEAVSQPQKHRRKIEIISETDSGVEDAIPRDSTSRIQETSPKGIIIFASFDKSDSDTFNADHNELSESEHKEAEKVMQVSAVEEKTNGYTEPLQERITQLHAAAKDSANQTKYPLGVALQAEQPHKKQERVTEPHAVVTDSGLHTKDAHGGALQADGRHEKQERIIEPHTAATNAENHAKDGVALLANQQQEKKDKFETKEIPATTDIDEKPIKTESSSSRVSIRKMVASNAEQAPPNKEIREDVTQVDKLAIAHEMLDQQVGVVTLTGENRGATMHLSSEPGKREEAIHIQHNYMLNPDDNEATTDGEVNTMEDIFEDHNNKGDQQRVAYINSNIQSVNNSIVYNSSVTERNPGVAVLSSNPPEAINSNKESDYPKTHKSQVIQTPTDRLIYESTIRRRCLRGLFLESSDSEPDNPAKPRHHGCRYVCGKQSKETDIGVF